MAARDRTGFREPHVREDVAAKAFDQREPFARRAGRRRRGAKRSGGQPRQHRLDQIEACAHLLDADPDARVDIAFTPRRNPEADLVVGGIRMIAPRVEIAGGSAADHAPGAEPGRQNPP